MFKRRGVSLILLGIASLLICAIAAKSADALPSGYSYQLVTPQNKTGEIGASGLGSPALNGAASPDGEHLLFTALAPSTEDAEGAPLRTAQVSSRGDESWLTRSISAFNRAANETGYLQTGVFSWLSLADATFERTVQWTNVNPITKQPRGRWSAWLRDERAGTWTEITPDPALGGASYTGSIYGAQESVILAQGYANSDLSIIYYATRAELTPDAVALPDNEYKTYRWEDEELTLTSYLPDPPVGGVEVPQPTVIAGGASTLTAPVGSLGRLGSVSNDGEVVVLQSHPAVGDVGALWRRDAAGTELVSVGERSNPADNPSLANMNARFQAMSDDGRRIFFVTRRALVDEDPDGTGDLYMYDTEKPAGERLTLVSLDQEPADGIGADVRSVFAASRDGHRIYFGTTGQLIDGAPTTPAGKLYLWEGGDDDAEMSYVAGFQDASKVNSAPFSENQRVTPNGSHLLFRVSGAQGVVSTPDGDVGQIGAAEYQLYLYDAAQSGQLEPSLRCVSCPQDGPSGGVSDLKGPQQSGVYTQRHVMTRNLTIDGSAVSFQTSQRLVESDTNGVIDTYMWKDDGGEGQFHLISSGRRASPSYFWDADETADNVFFMTQDRLTQWDSDARNDIYVASTDPAFPDPKVDPPGCETDATCQGDVQNPPSFIPPASSEYEGSGNDAPWARCQVLARRLGAAKRKLTKTMRKARQSRGNRKKRLQARAKKQRHQRQMRKRHLRDCERGL